MKIKDAITTFHTQFSFEPAIEHGPIRKFSRFIVCGMGGSNHATALIKMLRPESDIIVHRNYGLPALSEQALKESLIICSSYSGNTEETLDGFSLAGEQGLARAAVATGGTLIGAAENAGVPYVRMPAVGIQPRSAVGYSFRALLRCMGDDVLLKESALLANSLDALRLEDRGKALAQKIYGRIPVVYAAAFEEALAYNWRIRFHETAKVPSFHNVFPELNHNEMNGFDVQESTQNLSKNMHFIFLKDPASDPRILKRIDVTEKLYRDRGFPVEVVELEGATRLDKVFSSIILADWIAYYTALGYGTDPEEVPMVEEFKNLITK